MSIVPVRRLLLWIPVCASAAAILGMTEPGFASGDPPAQASAIPIDPLTYRAAWRPPATEGTAPVRSVALTPAGYCPSIGGSNLFESISKATVVQNLNQLAITVDVLFSNPVGCTPGGPCPEYTGPVFVNAWIDFDGDHSFEKEEQVLRANGVNSGNPSYQGTLTFTATVTIPARAFRHTTFRVNLGWAHDANNACEYEWEWGDVEELDLVLDVPNQPPLAQAGPAQSVELASCEGSWVMLDGSASEDDGQPQPLRYQWTWPGGSAVGATASVFLPPGATAVTLTVSDGEYTAIDSVVVTVADTRPPEVRGPGPLRAEFADENGAPIVFEVTATDACLDQAPQCEPASGGVFPIGTTIVRCAAIDRAGLRGSYAFSVTVWGARTAKENVLADLMALRAAATRAEDIRKLDEAAERLQDSLAPELWQDETHLLPKDGQKVFQNEREAVHKLLELLKDHRSLVSDTDLRDLADGMVKADRLLAMISIRDAEALGLNPKKIQEDLNEVAKGDRAAAEAQPDKAIEHYRHAWKHAVHLLVKATRTAAGVWQLQFIGIEGGSYLIQATSNLVDWVNLGTARVNAEGYVQFNDPQADPGPIRFYRVIEP